ncbi:MAG: S-layer homology domain-containing protein, partial [Firmicutes bacterium]|nr:S-layer homology domain-containing protein [Bacillota bacterium]
MYKTSERIGEKGGLIKKEMRQLKGLICFLVFTVALFGLAAAAGAATFKDVAGTKYASPVEALSALKIIDGYPDGTILPEQTITRAEFAKLVCLELGFGAAVNKSPATFPDVPESHWAGGFINMAVGQGILKGYEDGAFRPDADVTYAEAVTMLVRMLGFAPAMDEGDWPASYLAKASQLGLTKGVAIDASARAKRGDIFTLACNALDADTMVQSGWGTEQRWVESENFGDSILARRLNIKRVGNSDYPVTVTAVKIMDTSLDKNQIRVKAAYRRDPDKADRGGHEILLNAGEENVYEFREFVDPVKCYIGCDVELWLDKNNKLVFIKSHTDPADVFSDTVDDYDIANKKLKMLKKDKEYTVDEDAVVFWCGNYYDAKWLFDFWTTTRWDNKKGKKGEKVLDVLG